MPDDDDAYLVLPPRDQWARAFADGYLRVLSLTQAQELQRTLAARHGYAALVVKLQPVGEAG